MLENTDKEPSNTQSHKGWTWFHMFLCLQPGICLSTSFPSDFRDKLWVGFGFGIGFRKGMLFQDPKKNYVDPKTFLTWQNHTTGLVVTLWYYIWFT